MRGVLVMFCAVATAPLLVIACGGDSDDGGGNTGGSGGGILGGAGGISGSGGSTGGSGGTTGGTGGTGGSGATGGAINNECNPIPSQTAGAGGSGGSGGAADAGSDASVDSGISDAGVDVSPPDGSPPDASSGGSGATDAGTGGAGTGGAGTGGAGTGGAGTGGAGTGGAGTGGAPGDGGGPPPIQCGTNTCTGLSLGGFVNINPCCTVDGCGMDIDATISGFLGLAAGCYGVGQVGKPDTSCPMFSIANPLGGGNIDFQGCCRPSGECGFNVDTSGFGGPDLGCTPQECNGGPAKTCTP